jgi:hypothetical protein
MCYREDCSDLDAPRPGTLTTEIRADRTYLVDFTAEVPRLSRWTLRHCMGSTIEESVAPAAVVVRVHMPSRMDIRVWADGQHVPTAPGSVSYTSEAGSNYFEDLDSRQYIVLPCDAVIDVHQIVTAIVTVRFAVPIETYVTDFSGAFVDSMAKFLQVPSEQVDVLEVYPGSTVVRFRVLGADSSDYDPTLQAADVNTRVLRLLTSTIEQLQDELKLPVEAVDDVEWAKGVADRPLPAPFTANFTTEFIIAISVCSVLAFVLLLVGIWRIYVGVLKYREMEKVDDADPDELQGLNAEGGVGESFAVPDEDMIAPKAEAGHLVSLKIHVAEDDDDDDDDAGRGIGARNRYL